MQKLTDHAKRQGANYAKLIAAIGALTGAVSGYLELAQRNEIIYQALASKVNNMAVELGELKGQNQVMLLFLARSNGMEEMVDHLEAPPAPSPSIVYSIGDAAEEEGAIPVMEGATEISVESDEPPLPKEKTMVIQAYQELPANLDDLMQAQEQLQVPTE